MPTQRQADVFEVMHDLLHVHRAQMARAVAAQYPDLTMNEVRALGFIGRHPGATQRDLVRHSGADKAQIARMVAQLAEQGWISSTPNPDDRRSRVLALSPEGKAVQESIRNLRQSLSAKLLASCDATGQTQLLSLLENLLAELKTSPGCSKR